MIILTIGMSKLLSNIIFVFMLVAGITQLVFLCYSVYNGYFTMSVVFCSIGVALSVLYLIIISKDIIKFNH